MRAWVRRRHALPLATVLLLGGVVPVAAQTSPSSIVEEALQGVEADQARDAERVREIVDEAVKGAAAAPSGRDTVNPVAPSELRPLPQNAPEALPAGYRPEDLTGKPVRDGTSVQIGTIRALAVDETSGAARAMVAFAPIQGQAGKIAALEVAALVPASQGDGFAIQLTPTQVAQMPAYTWQDEAWRRVDS